jgi:hypothetical protein
MPVKWMHAHATLAAATAAVLLAIAPVPAQQPVPGASDAASPAERGFLPHGMMMGPGPMGGRFYGRMCGPAAAGFAEWRIGRIERAINLTEEQRAKLNDLRSASTKAAELIRSACPSEVPVTATARMAAMEKRLEGMLQAVRTVRPALDVFYAALTDEQKARLNSVETRFGMRWRNW